MFERFKQKTIIGIIVMLIFSIGYGIAELIFAKWIKGRLFNS